MTRPRFTLAIVASADGFIARGSSHAPQTWASAEEQALFFAEVEAADWAVMGRHTHLAADKPERRRIVFSAGAGAGAWRRPTQLWVDPAGLAPGRLAELVAPVRPLERGLILGGTRVHDWFHAARAIDLVKLTIEPLRFGSGLPIFSGQPPGDPRAAMEGAGFRVASERLLNAAGTRYLELLPARPGASP